MPGDFDEAPQRLWRNHWLPKLQPRTAPGVEVDFRRTFSPDEAGRLRRGMWPQHMEDKWVIFLGESSLDMWRSWTGHCIFSLPATFSPKGVLVGPLWVNNDATQYRRQNDAEDVRIVDLLINKALRA